MPVTPEKKTSTEEAKLWFWTGFIWFLNYIVLVSRLDAGWIPEWMR